MKKIFILVMTLTLISFVFAYTAQSYDSVDLVLNLSYTAQSYDSVDLVLGVPAVSDTCSCPGLATNWEISLADYCNITANCNISTGNITFINTGYVLFNATLTANQIDFKDSVAVVEEYNLGSNFRGWVG